MRPPTNDARYEPLIPTPKKKIIITKYCNFVLVT